MSAPRRRPPPGCCIDVGASRLIVDGEIRPAHGRVKGIAEDGLILEDGAKRAADLVVRATGHGSGAAGDPGPRAGERRNMWKPTQQAGLRFHGGDPHQSRHHSRFLALRLKARMEGIETHQPG